MKTITIETTVDLTFVCTVDYEVDDINEEARNFVETVLMDADDVHIKKCKVFIED